MDQATAIGLRIAAAATGRQVACLEALSARNETQPTIMPTVTPIPGKHGWSSIMPWSRVIQSRPGRSAGGESAHDWRLPG